MVEEITRLIFSIALGSTLWFLLTFFISLFTELEGGGIGVVPFLACVLIAYAGLRVKH